jgi:hypothetical protein
MRFSGERVFRPAQPRAHQRSCQRILSAWSRWRDRSILFETELGECLGNKTFLISLAAHGQVEDHRCDTLPRPTAFVGRETKLGANDIKGPEHALKVMRLEGTGP